MPEKIDPELRARAVRLVLEHQQEYPSVTEAMVAVSKQLGVSRESVRRWVSQADVDVGCREGVSSPPQHGHILTQPTVLGLQPLVS